MKLCKDCRYCDFNVGRPDLSHCTHPSYLTITVSAVTGEEMRSWVSCNGLNRQDYAPFCETLRKYTATGDCGPDATLFEPLEQPVICDERR